MKKIFAFIIAVGITLSISGIFTSCANSNNGASSNTPVNYQRIYDFEEYSEFNTVMQGNLFGKYSLNKDENFVSNGKGSACLIPSGSGYGNQYSKPNLIMYPAKVDESYSDFSYVEQIVFDIYNTSEKNEKCYFYLRIGAVSGISTTETMEYTLAPQSWTRCVYPVDYERLIYSYDLTQAESMNLAFDSLILDANRVTYYLDNVMFKYTNEVRSPKPIDLGENEVCDFENSDSLYWFYVTGFGAYTPAVPQISLNTDIQYVTSGNSSLKLHIPCCDDDTAYVRLMFCSALIDELDLGSLENEYDIVFDVYNDSVSTFYFSSELYVDSQTRYEISFIPQPGQWTECRLNLKTANDRRPSENGEDSFVSRATSFVITYGTFIGGGVEDDKDVYIDNIRLEKGN